MDRAQLVNWLRRRGPGLAAEVVINFAVPVLIFDALQGRMGEVNALLVSSIPPLVWGIGGFIRQRRIDALSVLAMTGIALSLLAFLGGGSVQMLALREKMVTVLIGLTFLGSAAIGKPLIYPLARATMARESDQALAEFDAKRGSATVHHTVMVMTLVWGFGLLADAAVSVALVYSLPMSAYLIAGPIVGYGSIGGLTLWTVLYRRYRTRYAAALREREKNS